MTRAFSVSKYPDTENEDRWAVSQDGLTCALSDGASVSFDSATWAEVLVGRFVQDPYVSKEWIDSAIAQYMSTHDRETMQWMQQGAFDRGSSATLLGVSCSNDGKSACIFALGDTTLIHLVDGKIVRSLPYLEPSQFDQSPLCFSTNRLENSALNKEVFTEAACAIEFDRSSKNTLLLVTDALARWLLEQPDGRRTEKLMSIASDTDFREFVGVERAAGTLRRDDTTLVVIS